MEVLVYSCLLMCFQRFIYSFMLYVFGSHILCFGAQHSDIVYMFVFIAPSMCQDVLFPIGWISFQRTLSHVFKYFHSCIIFAVSNVSRAIISNLLRHYQHVVRRFMLCNLIELKSDLFKLTFVYRRPVSERAATIGAWKRVLRVIVGLSSPQAEIQTSRHPRILVWICSFDLFAWL